MKLLTPGTHRTLHRDAYLIDDDRPARPLVLRRLVPLDVVMEALVERVALMGRSVYAVRNRTFALFFRGEDDALTVAPTAPFHDGVQGALRDSLAEYGPVHRADDVDLRAAGLDPLLAYERGTVSLFDTPATRPFLGLAARRGLRILGCTTSGAPDPDVEIDGVPAPAWLERQQVEEIGLDLDALAGMDEGELERALDEELEGWDGEEDRR